MDTGVGCHFLLQGISPIQGLNPHLLHLLHWQVNSLPLLHLGSPQGYWGHWKSTYWTSRWFSSWSWSLACSNHFLRSSLSHKSETPGWMLAACIYSHFMGHRAVHKPTTSSSKPLSDASSCEDSGHAAWQEWDSWTILLASGTSSQNTNGFSPTYSFISGKFLIHEHVPFVFEPEDIFLAFLVHHFYRFIGYSY